MYRFIVDTARPVASFDLMVGEGLGIAMPLLTEAMKEGRVVSWARRIGDRVFIGDTLCTVMVWPGNELAAVLATVNGFLAKIITSTNHIAVVGAPMALVIPNKLDLRDATAGDIVYNTSEVYNFTMDNNFTTNMTYAWKDQVHPWQYNVFRSLQFSQLTLSVTSLFGSFMFPAGLRNLLVLNGPSIAQRSAEAGVYPSAGDRVQRSVYSGADREPGEVSAGSSGHIWFDDVVLQGRLNDLNRALVALVYRPRLNWNRYPLESNPHLDTALI